MGTAVLGVAGTLGHSMTELHSADLMPAQVSGFLQIHIKTLILRFGVKQRVVQMFLCRRAPVQWTLKVSLQESSSTVDIKSVIARAPVQWTLKVSLQESSSTVDIKSVIARELQYSVH